MSPNIYINKVSLITSTNQTASVGNDASCPDLSAWFDANSYLGRKGHRYYSEPVKYLLAAATQVEMSEVHSDQVGVFIATDTADRDVRHDIYKNIANGTDGAISPAFAPNSSVNMPAGCLSQKYGFCGPSFTFTGKEGSACIALWRAIRQIERNEINMALVGQVEYLKDDPLKGGAMLWHISQDKTTDTALTIKYKNWQRWSQGFNKPIDLSLNRDEQKIYVIGHDNDITNRLVAMFKSTNKKCVRLNDSYTENRILPIMHHFFLLSLLVLQEISATVFLVSDKGQIFHYQLTNEELKR